MSMCIDTIIYSIFIIIRYIIMMFASGIISFLTENKYCQCDLSLIIFWICDNYAKSWHHAINYYFSAIRWDNRSLGILIM
jgi:hypothetical protein